MSNSRDASRSIVIDAQLPSDGSAGGVQQFVTCLVWSLGRLTDGPEHYVVIAPHDNMGWLKRYIGPNQQLVPGRSPPRFERLRRQIRPLKTRVRQRFHGSLRDALDVPTSDGFFEAFGGDVIHFPYAGFFRTSLASVFNPHDLQHLHYPEFFDEEDIIRREISYRAGCEDARAVVTEARWVKDDITRQYGTDPTKVFSIPWGSPSVLYPEVAEADLKRVEQELSLPDLFALYPAQTWPHKNHLRLLDAVHALHHSGGPKLVVICTGRLSSHWPVIEQRRRELGLDDFVRFLGYVDESRLRALYRRCTFVIIPSLFEGGGFPVLEAFSEGAPVTASDTTSIPEYAGDAALFFDPFSTDAIADAMSRMSIDAQLRRDLASMGERRASLFDWARTARAYRAIYRLAGNFELTPEDSKLLEQGGR